MRWTFKVGSLRKRLLRVLLAAAAASLVAAPVASADPSSNNPQVQYRTFSCDNGQTYSAAFVGPASNFLLLDSTSMFVIKVFTEIFPSGETKTFHYWTPGF